MQAPSCLKLFPALGTEHNPQLCTSILSLPSSCYLCKQKAPFGRTNITRSRRKRTHTIRASSIVEFSSDEFALEGLLGTFGYMNVSSGFGNEQLRSIFWTSVPDLSASAEKRLKDILSGVIRQALFICPSTSPFSQSFTPPATSSGLGVPSLDTLAAGYDMGEVSRMGAQEVGEGDVQVRLYRGRIAYGSRMGTRVLLKAYPRPGGGVTGVVNADVLAANELAAHAILQDAMRAGGPGGEANLSILLGGFQTQTGEQWLVFRDDGRATAASYCALAAAAAAEGRAVGEWDFWDRFDRSRMIRRRRIFVIKALRGALAGLAFMHAQNRLHQSLGPSSLVLNTMEEREPRELVPRLRDLAFSVDVSDEALMGGPTLGDLWDCRGGSSALSSSDLDRARRDLSEGLWRRATSAGARIGMEKRAFGFADDIYAAGLLLAYMAFVPFSEVGSIDGPSLQRLLESTFRLDIEAAREYCAADDRWADAVAFLDLGNGSGWALLQAMMNADYRKRPTAEAVLTHPWLSGEFA